MSEKLLSAIKAAHSALTLGPWAPRTGEAVAILDRAINAWNSRAPTSRMKMLVDSDWLRSKVASDPDVDAQAYSRAPTSPVVVDAEEVAEVIGYHLATLVSRNNMPHMSGDPRNRLLPHERRWFDDACNEAAHAILNLIQTKGSGDE